jgi:mediator of RNA polymerase II transcription subunit 21
MDKVTQLQEQLNFISFLFFNSIGTLQRDAPPIGDKTTPSTTQQTTQQNGQPSTTQPTEQQQQNGPSSTQNDQVDKHEEIKKQAIAFGKDIVQACIDFDKMVDELPGVNLSEEEQIKDMERLDKENEEEAKKLKEAVENAGIMVFNVQLC